MTEAKAKSETPKPTAGGGRLLLPSAFKDTNGKPRFVLPIPRADVKDVAIKHLIQRETVYGGYEYPTRAFFDAHLEPGDLFIDVGAHWGVMALSAATRAPHEIKVLAIEAHPLNAARLIAAVSQNRLQDSIEIVAAAAGDEAGTAPLVTNSTMGHSLHGLGLEGMQQGDIRLSVPTITLDELLDERPELQDRRTFIKIDVEGFEPQVLAGASKLLESGRVAALIWEKGRAFDQEPGKTAIAKAIERLEGLGFTFHVFPSHDLGGPLLPYVAQTGSCNVFGLAPGFQPRPAYLRPFGPIPPVPSLNRGTDDPDERAALTEVLAKVKGSDGLRWSDPQALAEGAEARAELAAKHLRAGERVLDLGAGLMRLRGRLPEGCRYRPLDLVPFAKDTLVMDLNQGQFPRGDCDAIAALELLEYIHDLPALLGRARSIGSRLLCTYRCSNGEAAIERRRQGWFNDYTEQAFRELLETAGWQVEASETGADTKLFVCAQTKV